jgi:SAM-dependent methyltransferase
LLGGYARISFDDRAVRHFSTTEIVTTSPTDDYVLGVNDVEIARLGLQHAVWRPRASDAWRRAGFTLGQHVVDVGCGPGYATLDLAAVVGEEGRITAIDRSQRFLDVLAARTAALRIRNVKCHRVDLDEGELPRLQADAAWCRWVYAFVHDPRRLLRLVRDMLRPGGTLVLHEYFDYATWRMVPRLPELEEFVVAVMKSWRASGGEPDAAVKLLPFLEEDGFEILELRPIIDVVSPRDFGWQWLHSFVASSLERQVELGALSEERSRAIGTAYERATSEACVRMVTPGLLEMIVRRR